MSPGREDVPALPTPHGRPAHPRVGLYYDEDAYVEAPRRNPATALGRPAGLMGRQVAGRAFLDAYLSHGAWSEMVGIVQGPSAAESLLRTCQGHPSSRARRRRLITVRRDRFFESFLRADPPATILHLPCPPESRFAWARQSAAPGAFAITGVTHTLCSEAAVRQLRDLVTAPFEPYDALVCTSRAVVEMVRAVCGSYAEYLAGRFGGSPRAEIRIAQIPLGVDTSRYRPASPDERTTQRRLLGISEDATVALFVGRISHHAKAHPYPMFQGLSRAAAETGRPVHLILAGWTANDAIRTAFEDGARRFAPGVSVQLVAGDDPGLRLAVWRAADLFTSLSDNIQETFGLVVLEAMACGLPVVASDWDGYRDLVVDGETGLLVPTAMVPDSTRHLGARLMFGELTYDRFLAEFSQSCAVDVAAAARAYRRLIEDPDLRRRMGEAARQRALKHFEWARIIRAYEALWAEQDARRLAERDRSRRLPTGETWGEYPEAEAAFRAYPTVWLGDSERVEAVEDALDRLDVLLESPLTNHSDQRRASDREMLAAVLRAVARPRTVSELDVTFRGVGVGRRPGRATLAWLLKYDLLRLVRHE